MNDFAPRARKKAFLRKECTLTVHDWSKNGLLTQTVGQKNYLETAPRRRTRVAASCLSRLFAGGSGEAWIFHAASTGLRAAERNAHLCIHALIRPLQKGAQLISQLLQFMPQAGQGFRRGGLVVAQVGKFVFFLHDACTQFVHLGGVFVNDSLGFGPLGGRKLLQPCSHISNMVGCGASRRRRIFRIVGLIRRRWPGQAQTGQDTNEKKGFHHKRPSEE